MTFSSLVPSFSADMVAQDPDVFAVLTDELTRQQNQIELIASENFTSTAVMAAQGSVLTNKYAEGYPGRRYYGGCEVVDRVEVLAQERVKKLFGCAYANVQPHSGSGANQGVFLALLNPGDTIMGLSLDTGGHLTHGSSVNLSGKWFHAVSYGTDPDTHLIDYDALQVLAQKHRPKLIIGGGSAYPRHIDFKRMRDIADAVGAYLLIDMAHFAGLVAGGQHPSPFPHAHVVTSTTHKTLRGPRGGIILTNDAEISKKINSAIFPGLQGGPLMHVIAAKAVAFGECLTPDFRTYSSAVIANCKAMGRGMESEGLRLITGGTDTHLLLVDLTPTGTNGRDAQIGLETAGMTVNKNTIPSDPLSPHVTSGIRVGSPAGTSRGFDEAAFTQIGQWIGQVCKSIGTDQEEAVSRAIRQEVETLCRRFPLYSTPRA